MEVFKTFIFISVFMFSFPSLFASPYESILDQKDYIRFFKLSTEYEKYKKKIEDLIEKNRINNLKLSDLKEIDSLLEKTNSIIDEIYPKYSDNPVIKSQFYQIRFEIEETKKIISNLKKNFQKKSYLKENIYKIEYYLFRMSIYLKGISQNLSTL